MAALPSPRSLSLGYDSVSSFIALFRRILGTTPARFAA
jgi:AraC-like DNA-binding protein